MSALPAALTGMISISAAASYTENPPKRQRGRPRKVVYGTLLTGFYRDGQPVDLREALGIRPGKGWRKGQSARTADDMARVLERIEAKQARARAQRIRLDEKAALREDMIEYYMSQGMSHAQASRRTRAELPKMQVALLRFREEQRKTGS